MNIELHIKIGVGEATGIELTRRLSLYSHRLGHFGWVLAAISLMPWHPGFIPWVTWDLFTSKEIAK